MSTFSLIALLIFWIINETKFKHIKIPTVQLALSRNVSGDQMPVPQVRPQRQHPEARRPLRHGTQRHQREDLHLSLVLVPLSVHCQSWR